MPQAPTSEEYNNGEKVNDVSDVPENFVMISHVLCMSSFHQQYLIANIMCTYVQGRHQTYDSDRDDEDIGKGDHLPEPATDCDSDWDNEDSNSDDENMITQVREIS